ncbi:MAG TPA: hypothetical protein VJY34_06825 [Roseiarcus sp.]|nr:hypothetical protein [Roseiarcus sp.]
MAQLHACPMPARYGGLLTKSFSDRQGRPNFLRERQLAPIVGHLQGPDAISASYISRNPVMSTQTVLIAGALTHQIVMVDGGKTVG